MIQNTVILRTERNTNNSDTTFEGFIETANKIIAKLICFMTFSVQCVTILCKTRLKTGVYAQLI